MAGSAHEGKVTPPEGTVTYFFSDIEGSTKLVAGLGAEFPSVLTRHRKVLRAAFAAHGGYEDGTEGDSFFVVFADAASALVAAVEATRNLAASPWPDGGAVRVRIGLHTGAAHLVDAGYVGLDVHRAARIAAAGHGGQILLSESTRVLVERSLPPGVSLLDMGEHGLKDFPEPEHLAQVVIEGEPNAFPPLRSLERRVVNLPMHLPEILGRESEIAGVQALLRRSPLVTVTGPGGSGKTRLVQEVARRHVAAGGETTVFVPLEALTDAELISAEILRAMHLDIAAARNPLERLLEHAGDRRILLVLDNLEQLDAAGQVIRALLDRAPNLTILAASQAAVHLAQEQEFAIGPLALAPMDGSPEDRRLAIQASPAVQLFVERAQAVRASFVMDSTNMDAIVLICERLEGLPLAIELAAAQIRLLSPAAILDRISGQIDALASQRQDLPVRQRTLRATVTWSYDLLKAPEQALLRRCATFAGGARLDAIEGIAVAEPRIEDILGLLGTLVDRSLITVRQEPDGSSRFALRETLRAFGLERLTAHGEAVAAKRRHAELFRQLAGQAEPGLYGPERRVWLDRLANDHDNLRAALDTFEVSGDLATALAMCADLWRFWQQRGHLLEGRERLDRLLATVAATGAMIDLAVLSAAEEAAGNVRYWNRVEGQSPIPHYERSLELAEASGDPLRRARAMYNLAFVFDFTPATVLGTTDRVRAAELRSAALKLFREQGDMRGVADSLWAMGGSPFAISEDPAAARALLGQAREILDDLGNVLGLSWVAFTLGLLDAGQGNLATGRASLLEAMGLFVRDGDTAGEIVGLYALASVAARNGDPETAVRLSAAAAAAARERGAELPEIPPIVQPILAARRGYSAEDLRREEAIGVAIGARALIAAALEGWRSSRDSGLGKRSESLPSAS